LSVIRLATSEVLTGYKVYTYVEAIWPKSHGTKNVLAMTAMRALLPSVLAHTSNRLEY